MIYLDNAATSHPKAPGVAAAVAACLEDGGSSPGRASHRLARAASRTLYEAREACAATLGLPGGERLVLTGGATEALNLAILGSVPDGGRVAVSSLEHNAVMRPLRHLEATRGVRVRTVAFDACGRPDPRDLRETLAERPDLFVLTAASNVTGAPTPAADILEACRRQGIPVCLDASQAAGHLDLPAGAAFIAFSGHKGLLGPAGTGGLWLAPEAAPTPLMFGGTGSASDREVQPGVMPDRYESGTPNLPGLAGLLAALRWREGRERDLRAREAAATEALLRGLAALPGVTAPGPEPGAPRTPVVSISVADRDLGELALELDRRDICVRVGLHCAPAAHRSLGTLEAGGTLRFSPGPFTTDAEIQATLSVLEALLT